MSDHDGSDSEWEQTGSSSAKGHRQRNSLDPSDSSKKSGKKDLSHVACRFYRVGACSAGASCPFSHSQREPGQSKVACKWFQKGSCKFGHKCANAHILPGDAPSMDWKNKKASKQLAQAEAAANANGIPMSPDVAVFASQSPKQTAPPPPSGLSNMFGRSNSQQETGGVPEDQEQNQITDISHLRADHAGAAIGMSPVGLPLPSDLPLPAGATAAPASSTNGSVTRISPSSQASSSGNKPKPLSYASAVSVANAPAPTTGQPSPIIAKSPAAQGVASYAGIAATQSSPLSAHLPAAAQANTLQERPPVNPYLQSTLSPTTQSNLSRLSASVPSAFTFDQNFSKPLQSPALHEPHSPAYHHLSHQPQYSSPLAPPLKHSQSQTYSIPTRASTLNASRPLNSPGMMQAVPHSAGLHGVSGMGMPTIQRSSSNQGGPSVFGTSPFGNNAIFLSTSHEDDKEAYISRAARARQHTSARDMSPRGWERDAMHRGSYEGRSFTRNVPPGLDSMPAHYSSAISEDEDILEEELVPSSLKHLLTPDEKARRSSRTGGRSGFFNPFEDTEDDAEDLQRISKSVPSSIFHQSPSSFFSKAPGSPPVTSTLSSQMSGSLTPRELLPSAGRTNNVNGSATSNLARHLLSGHHSPALPGPRIERGFYTSSASTSTSPALAAGGSGVQSGIGGLRPAPSQNLTGTSLPQGLAAGLSRLHLIPAGMEHTGYTPQNSFVNSPPPVLNSPSASGLASGGGTSAGLGSNLNPSSSAFVSSYQMKLPTLATVRRTSSHTPGHAGDTQHVGSPLARSELPIFGTIGAKEKPNDRTANDTASHHEHEDDELQFDMDV